MILLSFGVLAVCKYTNFMIGNINGILSAFGSSERLSVLKLTLPLGISFYTFQSVSYVVDVYRGKHEPQKNFFKYALFVSFSLSFFRDLSADMKGLVNSCMRDMLTTLKIYSLVYREYYGACLRRWCLLTG